MTKKTKVFDVKLDNEEQELFNSIEGGEWKSISNLKKEADLAKAAASRYLRKDARVNIRISTTDLMLLKQKASYKGLPYQTFIASVLHEYAAGHFKDI